jgi:hypothetical protein
METYLKTKNARKHRAKLYHQANQTRLQLKHERLKKYWLLQPKVST